MIPSFQIAFVHSSTPQISSGLAKTTKNATLNKVQGFGEIIFNSMGKLTQFLHKFKKVDIKTIALMSCLAIILLIALKVLRGNSSLKKINFHLKNPKKILNHA